MDGTRVECLLMMGLIFMLGFPNLIYAEDNCSNGNYDCEQCKNISECIFALFGNHENKGFCINRGHNIDLTKSNTVVHNCSQIGTNTTNPSIAEGTTISNGSDAASKTNPEDEPPKNEPAQQPQESKQDDESEDAPLVEEPLKEKPATQPEATEPTDVPMMTASTKKDHLIQSKSFSGGVFFGGIVFAVVLMALLIYGWNKYQIKRNGTPVRYGLLNGTPSGGAPSREGYESK